MAKHIEIHIPLPDQTLDKHSLFDLNKDSALKWLRSLPGANLGETTRQLYMALVEFNQVKCNPKDRTQILEQLRHHVHVSNRGLEKHFLNKPIILPDKARKVAQLSDTLNKQMAIGYTIAANQLLSLHRLRRPKDLLATTFHRAITEHSLVLLRNFQLYRDEEPGFWKTIHELFYQALKHKIAREKVVDEIWGGGTLEQCYLRPMLLYTARPHQLRQNTQAQVFNQLSGWTARARVRGDSLEDCVFVFNPTRDEPPIYRELCTDTYGWLGIDSQELCNHLEETMQGAQSSPKGKHEIGTGLLAHLQTSWGTMLQRASVRVDREGKLQLSLGLFSTHYFVAGARPFSDFMYVEHDHGIEAIDLNEGLSLRKRVDPNRDAWSEAHAQDVTDRASKKYVPDDVLIEAISYEQSAKPAGSSQSEQAYRYYQADIVNASDRGYCISWPSHEPVKLNTGDVIGLRENDEESWAIGIIRWVKQVDEQENQLGLEVLSTAADPYAARLVKTGRPTGDYQRALMLPKDRDSGLPERVMLQKSAFAEGDAVEISHPGQRYRIRLDKCLFSSGNLGLFEFSAMVRTEHRDEQNIEPDETADNSEPPISPEPGTNRHKQEFDNLWDNL